MSRMKQASRLIASVALAFALTALSLSSPAEAQRGQWERIALKKVNMLADRDVIDLDRADGRFNALRLKASRGNINIYRIRVIFGNGERQDLNVDKKLREGEDTGAIDLSGRARVIDKIEMLYASSNLLKRAELAVFGRVRPGSKRERADADDDRDDAERPKNRTEIVSFEGWEKLGQRNVDLDFNSDRIWIGNADGRFDKIVLRAKGGDIQVRSVKVVYGDGKVDDIRVRAKVREGKMSKPLDVNGRQRGIRRIEMTYRRGTPGGRPILLEVFGFPALDLATAPDRDDFAENDEPDWQVLGSRDVDLSLDRDVISISRGEGPFDALAFHARGAAVLVYDIRVTFGNGKRQTIKVDERLRPGRQSKALDLKGNARRITKVEILYEKARKRGRRATVEVLGRKIKRRADVRDNLTGEDGLVKSQPIPRGWGRVGRRILHRDSKDGIIGPAGDVERFSEIVFRVTGASIRIKTATIRFKNGRKMRLRINGRFQDGDKTDPIDLRGRARRVEEIELDYDRIRGRDKVMIEVIGRKAEL